MKKKKDWGKKMAKDRQCVFLQQIESVRFSLIRRSDLNKYHQLQIEHFSRQETELTLEMNAAYDKMQHV